MSVTDLISRQDAIDAVADGLKRVFSENRDVAEILLKNVPSAQPERKKGEWLEVEEWTGDVYYDCSVCGNSWTTIDGTPWDNGMKFCPHCGARMEGETDDE